MYCSGANSVLVGRSFSESITSLYITYGSYSYILNAIIHGVYTFLLNIRMKQQPQHLFHVMCQESWMKEPFQDWKHVYGEPNISKPTSRGRYKYKSKEHVPNRKKGTCSVSFISHCVWCNSIGQPRNDNEWKRRGVEVTRNRKEYNILF